MAVRAVLGQQITVVAAIRLAGKLVSQYGAPLDSGVPGLTHVFPEADVLAAADLAALGMPKSRGRTLSGVAQALLAAGIAAAAMLAEAQFLWVLFGLAFGVGVVRAFSDPAQSGLEAQADPLRGFVPSFGLASSFISIGGNGSVSSRVL